MSANSCFISLFLVSRPWALGLLVCARYISSCIRPTSKMDKVLYRKSLNLPYLGRLGERNTFKVPWHQHRLDKYIAWMREKMNSWYNTVGSYQQTYVYCTRSKTQKKKKHKKKTKRRSQLPSKQLKPDTLIQPSQCKAHYFFVNLGVFFSGGGGASFCPKALIKSSRLSSSSCSALA